MRKSPPVKSVGHALNILEAFESNGPELGITELSKRLGMSKGAVCKIILTLEERGYLQKTPNEKYRIGPKSFEIGKLYLTSRTLVEFAHPYMAAMVQKTKCTAQLCILEDHELRIILSIESPNPLRVATGVGTRMPFHATAAGKAVLAYLSEDEREDLLSKCNLDQYTPNTITDPNKLREELIIIRKRGWSSVDEEFNAGMAAVASPVFNMWKRPVGSVVLSFPASLNPNKEELGQITREVAKKLEQAVALKEVSF